MINQKRYNKRLKEIRGRINKATPGPWIRGIGSEMHEVCQRTGPKIAHVYGGFDGIFIAHAHQDIELLLQIIDENIATPPLNLDESEGEW